MGMDSNDSRANRDGPKSKVTRLAHIKIKFTNELYTEEGN